MNQYLAVLAIFAAFLLGIFSSWYMHTKDSTSPIVTAQDCSKDENFGYANGAVMATRILAENAWLKEQNTSGYDASLTCEKVVKQLYDENYFVASHGNY
jgi:hypothetical protein